MQGKTVLITGANGGLGTQVTKTFLAAGASVAGVSLNIRPTDFTDPKFTAFMANISDTAAALKLAQDVMGKMGRVDVLVHLAGGFAGGRPVAEEDEGTLDNMLDINLRSTFLLFRAFLPYMRKAGRGRIIAIGSRAAEGAAANFAAYGLSKAAVVSLVRSVAAENKDLGITANCILPGTMDTPGNRASMPDVDPARWIKPQTVADLIFWLSSDAAVQVSGAVIPVYGRDV
ncbi:MAG: SDR family NAD(P)-dependent oxidoreductase [Acidobacteriia bacterium]|nr:SDR family NAD(P)-dependent oxidoreductase [Terriglobia bacterium]